MQNQKPIVLPISTAREQLRSRSVACSQSLSRSVARMTSFDAYPCLEYSDEIRAERETIDELLYIQHCRAALEQCIAGGAAQLRYTRQDGSEIYTRFQRAVHGGRVRIWGLA